MNPRSEQTRQWQAQRYFKGLCVRCGGIRGDGVAHCSQCKTKARLLYYRKTVRKREANKLRRYLHGLKQRMEHEQSRYRPCSQFMDWAHGQIVLAKAMLEKRTGFKLPS